MENKEFTPVKLHFDKWAYERACRDAEDKLMAIDKMSVWSANNGVYIKSKDLMYSFLDDPIGTFKDEWYRVNKEKIGINVNVDKLLELCDIDIRELDILREGVKRYDAKIGITDDKKTKLFKYYSIVKEDDYTEYTKSEKQNKQVAKLKKFIKSLKEVAEFTQVYPANIQQGLSSAITFDMRDSSYKINSSMFS
tara:strand:+ start:75 stop:656 length:582 start_codon:yes stop_codon:yes gene_type:complete